MMVICVMLLMSACAKKPATIGVSAPAPDAYKHFGLTPEKVATRITDFMRTRGIQ